jgi:hypothetical protein
MESFGGKLETQLCGLGFGLRSSAVSAALYQNIGAYRVFSTAPQSIQTQLIPKMSYREDSDDTYMSEESAQHGIMLAHGVFKLCPPNSEGATPVKMSREASGMASPAPSSAFSPSQPQGQSGGVRPGPVAQVTFTMKLYVQTTSRTGAAQDELVDATPEGKTSTVMLGVTRLFKGLDIALRSLAAGESGEFIIPPQAGHYYGTTTIPERKRLRLSLHVRSVSNAAEVRTLLPGIAGPDADEHRPGSGILKIILMEPREPSAAAEVVFGSTVDVMLRKAHPVTGALGKDRRTAVIGRCGLGAAWFDAAVLSMRKGEMASFMRDGRQVDIMLSNVVPPTTPTVTLAELHAQFLPRKYCAFEPLPATGDAAVSQKPVPEEAVAAAFETARAAAASGQNPWTALWCGLQGLALAARASNNAAAGAGAAGAGATSQYEGYGKCLAAEAAMELARYDDAGDLAQAAFNVNPEGHHALLLMARAARKAGHLADCRVALEKYNAVSGIPADGVLPQRALLEWQNLEAAVVRRDREIQESSHSHDG